MRLAIDTVDDIDFRSRMELLEEQFERLTAEAVLLSAQARNVVNEVLRG